MKRLLSICLTLTMLFGITTFLSAPTAADAVSKRTKAVRAYKKFLKNNKNKYKKFSLIYLNNDKIPELAVRDYFVELYTYSGGKIVSVGGQMDISYTSDKFSYYKKAGVYVYANMHSDIYEARYDKLNSKGNSSRVAYNVFDENVSSPKTKYYIYKSNNGKAKKVSNKKFLNHIKKVTKGKKLKNAKFYKNTKSGIKKHCK